MTFSDTLGADAPFSGLLATLFLVGLAGGFSHCIGMCGPFVMAQVAASLEKVPAKKMRELHRLTGGLLLPYHLGRISTYVLLGAAVATFSGRTAFLWQIHWVTFALLASAAVFFTIQGIKGLGVPLPRFIAGRSATETGPAHLLGKLAKPFFQNPTGLSGYLLGVVLGFLPCGMVYGALAASAAAGSGADSVLEDALHGALAMGAFALGTVPALMVTGVLGQFAGIKMRWIMRRIGPVFLFFSSGFLVYMAWRAVGAI
ncbi:MAG: sulfite exporter TauE/SafE family protein [Rhodospirillales bacterium]|nr:sulfite exporter TauE/SafE family protein [Rhodospirillales bacterium]